jgi:23S rRNA pseudouridine1911/1915/1917 synthase
MPHPQQVFTVEAEYAGERLDRFLSELLPDLSRTRLQELIAAGKVRVNGRGARPSYRVRVGDAVAAEAAPRPPLRAVPESIPLDVLYEDDDVVVVNKPAGMVVHAGAGSGAQHGTLVNALLGRYATLSTGSEAGGLRPGIVHRLDKETSGCIVVARNDAAHHALAHQFESRSVAKTYLALVHGTLRQTTGTIGLPIARDPKRRIRMTTRVPVSGRARAARTGWQALLRLLPVGEKQQGGLTLVRVALHTGRTHQIRVHFCAVGHPVVGDAVYDAPPRVHLGKETLPALGRNFLHAARICFEQPRTGERLDVRAPLPGALRKFLNRVACLCHIEPGRVDAALAGFL